MMQTFKRIWAFSKKRHGAMKKALLFSFLRSVFGITQIIAILLTIEVCMNQRDAKECILWIVGLTLICILGNFLTSYIEQINTLETGFFMIHDKRLEVGNHLRRLPLGYFSTNASGKISTTLTSTLSGVETAATMVMVGIISGIFSSVAFVIFMLCYDWRMGLITAIGMILYLCIVNMQMKVSRKQAPKLQHAQDTLSNATLTFLQGMKVIKTCSLHQEDQELEKAIDGSKDANIELTRVSMPTQYLAHLCIAIFESLIFITALYLRFVKQDITISQTILFIIFSFLSYAALNQAGSMLSMIGLLDAGMDEVEKIEKEQELEVKKGDRHAKNNDIVLDDVCFAYQDHEVLHHISATLKEHTCTAIIGPSGSGKTTLCHLIPRFKDVSSGSISIGGVPIKQMEYEELMSKISMVFQHVYLFEDTILNNIRFGKPDATLEEVRAAAKKACCDSFIMKLEHGYDTMIEEGGNNLSGGEKQRISIARAILKDAPIIILDEATSALDVENEHEIMKAIKELTKNKTVLMIAHRIQTVKQADCILALKDGVIVQKGTHEQLIAQDGLYKDFMNVKKEAQNWQLYR